MQSETRATRLGRPTSDQARNVPDAILKASRDWLYERSHVDLTLRDIAQRAGTSQEMISYYFGGRDGLLATLSAGVSDEIAANLAAVDVHNFDDGLAYMTAIVRALAEPSCHVPNLAAILVLETIRTATTVRQRYIGDGKSRTRSAVRQLIQAGIERGFYSPETDAGIVGLSLLSLVLGLPLLPSVSDGIDSERWIQHVGKMVCETIARQADAPERSH